MALGITIGLVIFLVSRNGQGYEMISCLALMLLVLFLLILLSAIEPCYLDGYYDAPMHTSRAVCVEPTGHSSISADSYFDISPGVSYPAAMLILVTRIPAYILTKWFDPFIVAVGYIHPSCSWGRGSSGNLRYCSMFACR